MDPAETLKQAQLAFDARDWDELKGWLEDYCNWRRRGGFMPVDGDANYQRLLKEYRDTLETQLADLKSMEKLTC